MNGQLVVDSWAPHTLTSTSGTISLTAGRAYAIRMDYREVSGPATAVLSWSYGSVTKTVLPQAALLDR